MATEIPTNAARFSLDEVVAATGGVVLRRADRAAEGVCTDSRVIAEGNLFVAIVGQRFDGHAHVHGAAERGAAIVVVSKPVTLPEHAGASMVLVDDTTEALGALARAHRRRWAARGSAAKTLVAITGSAGKTTTRKAVAAVLEGAGLSVLATKGNLNNAIGVPMMMLGLGDEHDVAVIEIGTSSPGEIAHGASIAEPDVAVLTLVAAAHTEGLGGIDGVAREKGELLVALDRAGVAIVNSDDSRCVAQLLRTKAKTWLHYGSIEGADVRLLSRAPEGVTGATLIFSLNARIVSRGAPERGLEVKTPLLGVAGAYATAAAVSVCAALAPATLTSERVSASLASLASDDGRLSARVLPDGSILIDDSYNANPASMAASLGTASELARAEKRRLLAVVGEMRELGDVSADEHRAIGELAAGLEVSCLVAVAGDASLLAEAARSAQPRDTSEIVFVADAQAAIEATLARHQSGDVVLIKGSRSVGLERVASALAKATGEAPTPP